MIALRGLGARIVVRDDDDVRTRFGDGAHERALAGIAIAATAEHADRAGRAHALAQPREPWPAHRACARSRPAPAAACRRRNVSMRPGGATHSASAASAFCSGTLQPSSTPSTASRFSALNSPTSRDRNVPAPQLLSSCSVRPCGVARSSVTRIQPVPCSAQISFDVLNRIRSIAGSSRSASSRPNGVAHVQHGATQARTLEQALLGRRVGFERARGSRGGRASGS